jgi:cytochrome c oxidase assembly protein subunit 19
VVLTSRPERGSFPLDHDGECKKYMTVYLSCIKTHRGTNSQECRLQAKDYLQCRMERNLMAPDEMRNLGFAEEKAKVREETVKEKDGR